MTKDGRPAFHTACLLLLFCASGCATDRYYATSLPDELVAPPYENPLLIELSQLATEANSSELIDCGDVIEVNIAAGLDDKDTVSFPARVNEQGIANLPIIGDLQLAELELQGAEAVISTAAIQRGLYRNPHVTVTMKQQRMNRVTVLGAVEDPGVHQVPRGNSDLLAALVAAGGLTETAGTEVEIRHPGGRFSEESVSPRIADANGNQIAPVGHSVPVMKLKQASSIKVDLVKATQNVGKRRDYRVQDGSIITVKKRDAKPIEVLGLVKKPGQHEIPPGKDLRLLGAISMAEGISSPVADKIYVIRRLSTDVEPAVIQVSYAEAKRNSKSNLRLAPGDVISVEQTPATIMLDAVKLINFTIGTSLEALY